MSNPKAISLSLGLALALVLAACAAPAQPPATATATPVVALAQSPPTATPQAPAATEPAAAGPYYPAETRTGIDVVDRVIAAYLAQDAEALRGLVHYTVTGCTHAEGLGGPPKCEAGQAEGAKVEVFPILGPEGGFVTRANIDRVFPAAEHALLAVFRVAEDAEEWDYWPAGDFGVVFIIVDSGETVTMLVTDLGIVRNVYTHPGQPFSPHSLGEYILPPLP